MCILHVYSMTHVYIRVLYMLVHILVRFVYVGMCVNASSRKYKYSVSFGVEGESCRV